LVAAAVLALVAACGAENPVEDRGERWSPPGFNEVVESARPGWARSLDTAAAQLLNLNRPFDGPVEIYLRTETTRWRRSP
jgi:hypothetical protein